jgi:hypothetical protein
MAANMVNFGSKREKDMLAFSNMADEIRAWHTLPGAMP